jgi:hypothetical protein
MTQFEGQALALGCFVAVIFAGGLAIFGQLRAASAVNGALALLFLTFAVPNLVTWAVSPDAYVSQYGHAALSELLHSRLGRNCAHPAGRLRPILCSQIRRVLLDELACQSSDSGAVCLSRLLVSRVLSAVQQEPRSIGWPKASAWVWFALTAISPKYSTTFEWPRTARAPELGIKQPRARSAT